MITNKFMLGNYVLDNEDRSDLTIFELHSIETQEYNDFNCSEEYLFTAKKLGDNGQSFYDLVPSEIPITEKWLLDFGFKQNELTFSLANDEYSITIFFCDLWQFQYKTPLESANLVNDFKVHELQNLYYSLTGRFLQLVGQTNG